eukprot:m.239624 g.239624  ORF g.239624 m.239624 type:complete len:399 (-) comp13508_c0_seq1:80-1276(-)
MTTAAELRAFVAANHGVVFAKPAIVYRKSYCGRSLIAPNSAFVEGIMDDRGYVPVEWWIMSKTVALNPICKDKEGLTSLLLGDREVPFVDALAADEAALLGAYGSKWPLTKVLDIGGPAVKPSFTSDEEAPPIPCHVHAGQVVDGKCQGCGKLEAYFFPPLDVPPYNLKLSGVHSRFGIRGDVKPAQVLDALTKFGIDDSIYALQPVYELGPWQNWTIRPKVIHSPGPWLTFEIQTPQDDFNLLAWQLGRTLDGTALTDTKASQQMRGFGTEEELFRETIDWDLNVDPNFAQKWRRDALVLEAGEWGRRIQIFNFEFYGEGFEIIPGGTFTRAADARPYAAIVWSGQGTVNGHGLDNANPAQREFLVTPATAATFTNTGAHALLVYAVFPLEDNVVLP